MGSPKPGPGGAIKGSDAPADELAWLDLKTSTRPDPRPRRLPSPALNMLPPAAGGGIPPADGAAAGILGISVMEGGGANATSSAGSAFLSTHRFFSGSQTMAWSLSSGR